MCIRDSLYGLETVDVERGQSVSTGDPLGTAGTSHSLIYELRIGSKSTDPQLALDVYKRQLYDTVSVPAEEDVGGGEEFRNAIWPLYTTGSSAKPVSYTHLPRA